MKQPAEAYEWMIMNLVSLNEEQIITSLPAGVNEVITVFLPLRQFWLFIRVKRISYQPFFITWRLTAGIII